MPPISLADELFPVPEESPHGTIDSLAVALRRAAAVGIIIFLLMVAIFLVSTETDMSVRGHARQLHIFFYNVGQYFEIDYKPDR